MQWNDSTGQILSWKLGTQFQVQLDATMGRLYCNTYINKSIQLNFLIN